METSVLNQSSVRNPEQRVSLLVQGSNSKSPIEEMRSYIGEAVKDYMNTGISAADGLADYNALGLGMPDMIAMHILRSFNYSESQIAKEFNISETALANYFEETGTGSEQLTLFRM